MADILHAISPNQSLSIIFFLIQISLKLIPKYANINRIALAPAILFGAKPLCESLICYFAVLYMRHSAAIS